MSAVLDAVASPDTRYRRPHNKLAKNLPMAEFRGKLIFPTTADISRDAEARRELLALAARVEGGPPPDLPPVLPPVQREMPPAPVVALQSPPVGLNEENEEAAAAPTATPRPDEADSDDPEALDPETLAAYRECLD
jgi:hypothetical protein